MRQFSAEPNPEERKESVADADIREQANQNRLTKQSLTGSDKEENEDEDSVSSNSDTVSNLSGTKLNSSQQQT